MVEKRPAKGEVSGATETDASTRAPRGPFSRDYLGFWTELTKDPP